MPSMRDEEERMEKRVALESAAKDYWDACQLCNYPFASDVIDVVFDASDGAVKLGEEANA